MGKYVFEECNSLPVTNNIIYADTYLVKISNKSLHSVTSDMIKEGTRWIGENAFYNYDNMTSIVIPEGVLKIGECAFEFCDNLGRITIPSSLSFIGNSAFYDCRKLSTVYISDLVSWCKIEFNDTPLSSYTTSRLVLNGSDVVNLVIPDSMTSIGNNTFSFCGSLKSVIIPQSVTSIEHQAFYRCSNLENVIIQGGVTQMDNSIFSCCDKLKSVTIHDGVTVIGKYAFSQCEALTDIIIPSSVTLIDDSAFSYCNSLTAITIPDGVRSIGNCAFSHCNSATDLIIPNTVESIGNFAFYYCSSLKEVFCRPVNPPVLGDSAFDTNGYNRKIYVPSKALDNYKTNWSNYANSIFSMSDDIDDLSKEGTANCYIVSKLGSYQFTPTKGNSNESVGDIASAEVLWETFGSDITPNVGDIVKNVQYADGVISFDTSNTFKEGNAVIAAKDESGNILWSWHLWFTDQPQGQIYYNNVGSMMDRNLGATSATPGEVSALGLLYQWGRKDPFLGSSSISSAEEAESTITWPSMVYSNSTTGTNAYVTANPITFVTYNSYNDDWYYTGTNTTDNTRWSTASYKKTIYDPCPSGWRVPSYDAWSDIIDLNQTAPSYDDGNKGVNFSGFWGSASTIWYPASGYRSIPQGYLSGVGSYAYYWSASPNSYLAYSLRFNKNGFLSPSVYEARSTARSIRCIQE